MGRVIRVGGVEGVDGATVVVGEGRRRLGFLSRDVVEDGTTLYHTGGQVYIAALRLRALAPRKNAIHIRHLKYYKPRPISLKAHIQSSHLSH
jgi:hypothetical protein